MYNIYLLHEEFILSTLRDHSTEQNHEIVDIARNTIRETTKSWT